MQRELERHLDNVRALENPHESLLPGRQPFFTNISVEPGPPLSPRQLPQDDSRRPSVADVPRTNMIRPPVPPHLAATPRRYGSIGAANSSPNSNRSPAPPIAPQQHPLPHPLSTVSSPPGSSLGRRHTSADIRQHGWPASATSPFSSSSNTPGGAAPHWPPSPHRTPASSDQQVRDVLARYEMGAPRRFQNNSRHATPPLTTDTTPPTLSVDNNWTLNGPKFPRHESSLPATRRSSMASNVHSLLNPTEKADDDRSTGEDRKRRRLE